LCGDEPVLLARRCAVPVVVAAKREAAIRRLNETGVDVIFSDDGLQQSRLPRALEICVVDGSRGLGNGHLIPAGPLRETAERLKCVDHVVSNGEWADKPMDIDVVTMNLKARQVLSLTGDEVIGVPEFIRRFAGKSVHAIAGIGHPQRFFNMLKTLGLNVVPHAFTDHHAYVIKDFQALQNETIIMTEKDAVKCRGFKLDKAWFIPVEVNLPDAFRLKIEDQLIKLARML